MRISLPRGIARASRYGRFLAWVLTQKTRERFSRRGKSQRYSETTRFMGEMKGLPQKLGQYLSMKNIEAFDRYGAIVGRGEPLDFSALEPQLHSLPDPGALARFDPTPLAAASIGQVHRAWLQDETPVAVKIRYPGIAQALRADFDGLTRLARIIGLFLPKSRDKNSMVATLDTLREELERELDYLAEAAALTRLAHAFADDPRVAVARPHPELCNADVLTMDFLEGPLLLTWLQNEPEPERRAQLVERLAAVLLEQAFVHHEIQADPHPGNFLAVPSDTEDLPRIGLLDLGCTLRAEPAWWGHIRELFRVARESHNDAEFVPVFLALGFDPQEVEKMAPMLGGLTRLAMRPFMEPEPLDLRDWRPTYELNMILSSRDFDSGLRAPGPFLLFVRAFHGLFFYAKQARTEVHLSRVLEESLASVV